MADIFQTARTLGLAGYDPVEIELLLSPFREAATLTEVVPEPSLRTPEGRQIAMQTARIDWWQSDAVPAELTRILDAVADRPISPEQEAFLEKPYAVSQ